MKKIFTIIFCLSILITGCKSQNKTTEKTEVTINLPQDNTVNGYYKEGTDMPETIPKDEATVPKYETVTVSFCGNKGTNKFHKLNCNSVSKIKEENKEYFATREEFIKNGYSPCKICNP